jgi:hypothetical protein
VDTYSQRRWDFRVGKDKIQQRMREAGQEGYWLLDQVEGQGSEELKALVEIEQLRRVLEEQFTRGEDGTMPPRPRQQAKGDVITTPHDPDVRYGYKGGQGWVGYKLQVTETADEGPRFITDVEIVPAMRQDNQCLAAIQDRLVARGIPPGKQYVDQAYMSGYHIADSLSKGIDLRGYVREGNLSKPEGFRLRDFKIDIEQSQAICPAGKKQTKWVRAKPGVKNLIAFHVGFGKQCQLCPHFGLGLCTDKPNGRHLGINAHHDLIQARRLETDTKAFRQEMHVRAVRELCRRWFEVMAFDGLAFAGHGRTSYRRSSGRRQSTSNGWLTAYLCWASSEEDFRACLSLLWLEFFNRIRNVYTIPSSFPFA